MNLQSPSFLGPEPLDAAFVDAHASGSPDAWSRHVHEIQPRVFAFPLLRPEACRRLLDEIDRRVASQQAGSPPNSMHTAGVALADIGLGDWLRDLRERWVAPLAELHFRDVGADSLDGEHGFLAEYGAEADDALGFHVDDSAVTLNLCLGDEWYGAELYFRGLRCDAHRQTATDPSEDFEIEHEIGQAILHAGRHRHGVHPLRRGRRRNLILWMQSSTARDEAGRCSTWCGRHAHASRASRDQL